MSSQSQIDWKGLISVLIGLAFIAVLVYAIFLPSDNPVKGFILTLGYAAPAIWALREAKGESGYVLFLYLGFGLTFAAMVVSQLANIAFKTNIDSLIVMAIGFSILIIGFSLKLTGSSRRATEVQAQPKRDEQAPWTNKRQSDVQFGPDTGNPDLPNNEPAKPSGVDTQNQD